MVVAPPIRRFFNDGPREKIPLTYPSKLSHSEDNCIQVSKLGTAVRAHLINVLQYRQGQERYRRGVMIRQRDTLAVDGSTVDEEKGAL